VITVIKARSSLRLELKRIIDERLSLQFILILIVKSLVDFVQQIFLEFFEVILIDRILSNWIKSKK